MFHRGRPGVGVACMVMLALAAGVDARQQGGGGRQATRAGCPADDPAAFYRCALEKIASFQPTRTPDGFPDMTGFWSRMVSTEDIHDRPEVVGQRAQKSLIVDLPDGRIPYQPWAAAQKKLNSERYISPLAFCDAPGIPRWNYQYGLWQVFMTPDVLMFVPEGASLSVRRTIRMDGQPHIGSGIKNMWLGDSVGRWEGNTLVVDVTNLNGKAWFDAAGDFQTENIHIVERFSLVDKDTMLYVADIDDETAYTRPWRMSFPIPRYSGDATELWEVGCHEGNQAVAPLIKLGNRRFPGVSAPNRR